jgi:hypothetical protein
MLNVYLNLTKAHKKSLIDKLKKASTEEVPLHPEIRLWVWLQPPVSASGDKDITRSSERKTEALKASVFLCPHS